jgi:hypothetical protein
MKERLEQGWDCSMQLVTTVLRQNRIRAIDTESISAGSAARFDGRRFVTWCADY